METSQTEEENQLLEEKHEDEIPAGAVSDIEPTEKNESTQDSEIEPEVDQTDQKITGPGDGKEKEPKSKSSLRIQIGLLYTLLALINILFFSVMIFENQAGLLNKNFNYQYREFVRGILNDVKTISLSKSNDKYYQELKSKLKVSYNISEFTVFDRKGNIWHIVSKNKSSEKMQTVNADLRRKSLELAMETAVFRTPYKLIPNSEDFTIDFLLPLTAKGGEKIFLHTLLHINEIKKTLNDLYIQIGIAVIVGIIFHILFGIFVFRVIFRRIGLLTDASNLMADGDLKARANWKYKRADELDELGSSFNSMATIIEEKIKTITRLNAEIQNELETGRDVQELFIPGNRIFKKYNIAVYYRPMREVSGDIYNFFNFKVQDEEYKAIFFADASGHGVSAALITAITLMSLPHSVVGLLNNLMCDRLQSSFFATGVFFIFDPQGNCFYTNAGHNPPLFIRPASKKVQMLEKCGPPLGMFEDVEYKTQKIATKPGDKIVMYTDGLVETKNTEEKMFTLERSIELILDNIDRPNKEITDLLAKELDDFAVDYNDDVSIIILEMPE